AAPLKEARQLQHIRIDEAAAGLGLGMTVGDHIVIGPHACVAVGEGESELVEALDYFGGEAIPDIRSECTETMHREAARPEAEAFLETLRFPPQRAHVIVLRIARAVKPEFDPA